MTRARVPAIAVAIPAAAPLQARTLLFDATLSVDAVGVSAVSALLGTRRR
jgi:hypothetical protein